MSGWGRKSGSCTAKSGKHDTHSGALRCPVHKHQARYARYTKGSDAPKPFPDPVLSSVPKRGAVHEESQLPFNTGAKAKGKHHNVGQEVECPSAMFESGWGGTWFQDATIKKGPTGYARFELDSPSSSHLSTSPLHLRDCKISAGISLRLRGGSSFVGGEGLARGVAPSDAPDVIASGTSRLEDLTGFSSITVHEKATLKNSQAERIAVRADAVAEGCLASKWFDVSGNAQVVIDHPGQCITISEDFSGVITENFPALIVTRGYEDKPQRLANDNKFDVFAELTRRKEDNSEGQYLHPHNHRAWDAFLEMGGLGGESNTPRQKADEDILSIAVSLHPNPAT